MQCASECESCKYQPDYCLSCINYELLGNLGNKFCVSECDSQKNVYTDELNMQCVPCNDSCNGCTGPTAHDCIKCKDVKVVLVSAQLCCTPEFYSGCTVIHAKAVQFYVIIR